MNKIWAIAWRDTRATFTDKNMLLLMLATPIVLVTIIAFAFGGISSGSSFSDIPVAIVNNDAGIDTDTFAFNGGQFIVSAFIAPESLEEGESAIPEGMASATCALLDDESETTGESTGISLYEMTQSVLLTDAEAARQGVDEGLYAAAIIIPEDFTSSMTYQGNMDLQLSPITVYGDSARPITAGIIRDIVSSMSNQFLTGNITIATTIDRFIERSTGDPAFALRFAEAGLSGTFGDDFSCAFMPGINNVKVDRQSVSGDGRALTPVVAIGAAQAVFFALFTAAGAASSILEERRDGTWQRMVMTPTSRTQILLGKLLSVFIMVFMQICILLVAFVLVNSILSGGLTLIWGTSWHNIVLLAVATSIGTAGIGVLVTSISKTVEQANAIGGFIAMVMGLLGGAFFTVDAIPAMDIVSRVSIVRWGSEGFTKLALGSTDVTMNILFLTAIGVAMFLIGLLIFVRRQDI